MKLLDKIDKEADRKFAEFTQRFQNKEKSKDMLDLMTKFEECVRVGGWVPHRL